MELPKNKEALVTELHKGIDDVSRKIDELRVQASLGKAEAKARFQEKITGLEGKRDGLREQLHHLQSASGSAFEKLSAGCQRSWTELRKSVEEAVAEFKS